MERKIRKPVGFIMTIAIGIALLSQTSVHTDANTSSLAQGPPPERIERAIMQGSDDAGLEELGCTFSTAHNEVYFGECRDGQDIVSGFRFENISISGPDEIQNAHLEFTVDGPYSNMIEVKLYGEATDSSQTFSEFSKPSERPLTASSITWRIYNQWRLGDKDASPELRPVLKEIVNRPGWKSGNAITILVKNVKADSTHRRVIAYERYGNSDYTARLVINDPFPNDLEVMYIERLPKYPRYHALYQDPTIFTDDWVPYRISVPKALGGGQTSATQRWPHVGDTVKFVTHVLNHGTTTRNGPSAAWYIDDQRIIDFETIAAMAPYQVMQIDLNWIWDGNRHKVKFEIEGTDDRPTNNSLEIFTDALAFCTFIERGHDTKFLLESLSLPQAITTSEIEWFQIHLRRMNEMLEAAGSQSRVYYDKLELIPDVTPVPGGNSEERYVYDGNYPEVIRAHEGTLRASGYYDPDEDLDYGLLHEQGHQLGLIDLYRMNVDASQNPVTGAPYSTVRCLMNGVDHFFSAHSALALNSWHGYRRGYFGTYLYDVPAQNHLRMLDADGKPLAHATVTVYQKITTPAGQEIIPDIAKFTGTTDVNGIYSLPNVNIDISQFVKTETGNIPRPNPFGYISLLGENGVFLMQIEKEGFCDYQWLDITRFNLAYWQGDTLQAAHDLQTNLSSEFELVPPLDLAESTANGWTAASSDPATNIVTFDESRKLYGQNSVRLETTSGFDVWLRYPKDKLARWDLTQKDSLRVWFYAENPSPFGFQNNSPWFRLINARCEGGYIEYKATGELLNQARNQWKYFAIPLSGNNTWQRTDHGNVSLSDINYLEIHTDTWDAGFTLWVDALSFDSFLTEVEQEVTTGLPLAFALFQNHPNPFTAMSSIRYQLAKTEHVTLRIFNVLGQEIRRLVDTEQLPGIYTVRWDGKNSDGADVTSGVYLYRFEANTFVQVSKLLLLR